MLSSEVPRLATDSLVRVFPGVWKLLSFLRLPSPGRICPYLLSLFLSFIFFPTSFQRQWAAFLGDWCPLQAFRSCSEEFTQRSNVLLMNLWGEKVVSPSYPSAILGPPPRYGSYSWFRKILWMRKWQPTAVFLPGKSHGQSLAGYSQKVRRDWAHTCMHAGNAAVDYPIYLIQFLVSCLQWPHGKNLYASAVIILTRIFLIP